MLSIPACKGFEIGSGFEGTKMRGSGHNDLFFGTSESEKLTTITNYSGGTLGGISNGKNVNFKVAFKPVSTIGME
jgi:chorismate synthase